MFARGSWNSTSGTALIVALANIATVLAPAAAAAQDEPAAIVIRDIGGPSWGAKLAADRGEIAGPRVWPSRNPAWH